MNIKKLLIILMIVLLIYFFIYPYHLEKKVSLDERVSFLESTKWKVDNYYYWNFDKSFIFSTEGGDYNYTSGEIGFWEIKDGSIITKTNTKDGRFGDITKKWGIKVFTEKTIKLFPITGLGDPVTITLKKID